MNIQIKPLSKIQFDKIYLLFYVDEMGFESDSKQTGSFITQYFFNLLVKEFKDLREIGKLDSNSEGFTKSFLGGLTQEQENLISELGYSVFEI